MATPTYGDHMQVDRLLPHSGQNPDMVRLNAICAAAPTRLPVNPVHIFLLTRHGRQFIIQVPIKQPSPK